METQDKGFKMSNTITNFFGGSKPVPKGGAGTNVPKEGAGAKGPTALGADDLAIVDSDSENDNHNQKAADAKPTAGR